MASLRFDWFWFSSFPAYRDDDYNIVLFSIIQSSQTVDQPYIDTVPYKVSEMSMDEHLF